MKTKHGEFRISIREMPCNVWTVFAMRDEPGVAVGFQPTRENGEAFIFTNRRDAEIALREIRAEHVERAILAEAERNAEYARSTVASVEGALRLALERLDEAESRLARIRREAQG